MTTAELTVTDRIRLRGEGIEVVLDRRTGAVTELVATETGWRVQDRAALAMGFQLLIPLPGRRNNLAYAEDQPAPRVEESGTEVVLSWPAVRSRYGGVHQIGVTQRIGIRGRQVVFETTIDNRSDRTVENVCAPCLGDLRAPAPNDELTSFCCSYGTASLLRMWPHFDNNCGYWGVDHPTQLANRGAKGGLVPVSPYMLVLARDQGLYIGVTEPRYDLVTWRAELVPGCQDSMYQRAPADAAIRFSAVHLPFVPPGETRALTPIAVEVFEGDWHAGMDVYRRQLDGWLRRPAPPAWAAEPHSWLQLHINSPEDELRIWFRDLPDVGRECAAAGIRAIQLVGWNDGGQDRGNPSHHPDPRLGTPEELRAAIAEIQALGVQVVLFTKFTWADRITDRYPVLARDAVRDPYGDCYNGAAYAYQTATQLLGVNLRHLIPMCFGSEHYLATCEAEFDTVAGLGAAGMLFDESCHHADALLCFDTAHGHPTPWPVYANDGELIRRFRRRASPDFLYAGEGLYDWQFADYDLSYFRSASPDHLPANRYLLPDALLMTAATGFDDRNIVNQCLLYRYVLSYEPYNFKGRPSDMPRTVEYGRRMDALRTELREWLWDGTFRDTLGATVCCAGEPHRPYAVFLHRDTGEPAVVVANYREDPVRVEIGGLGGDLAYRLVEDDGWRASGGPVELPPRSAAVVVPARSAADDR
jgi:uncharacterized protein DUF6259